MSVRSRAASWAQKRAIAKPFQVEMPTSPPKCRTAHGYVRPAPRRRARSGRCRSPRRPSRWRIREVPPISPSSRMVSANTSRPPRRIRQRSMNSPLAFARPSRPGRTPRFHRAAAKRSPPDRYRSGATPGPGRTGWSPAAPAETRARRGLQGNVELCGTALSPVDFFRSRRRQRQPRSFAGRDIDIEAIATGDATGGVDEHSRETISLGRGKTHPQRAGFMQVTAAGDAVGEVHVECTGPGPVGGENHRGRVRVSVCISAQMLPKPRGLDRPRRKKSLKN